MMDSKKDPLKTNTSSGIPLLAEISLSAAMLVELIAGMVIALVSLVSGARWYDIILRSSVTMLIIGALLIGFNWYFGKCLVEAKLEELKEAQAAGEELAEEVSPSESSSSLLEFKA